MSKTLHWSWSGFGPTMVGPKHMLHSAMMDITCRDERQETTKQDSSRSIHRWAHFFLQCSSRADIIIHCITRPRYFPSLLQLLIPCHHWTALQTLGCCTRSFARDQCWISASVHCIQPWQNNVCFSFYVISFTIVLTESFIPLSLAVAELRPSFSFIHSHKITDTYLYESFSVLLPQTFAILCATTEVSYWFTYISPYTYTTLAYLSNTGEYILDVCDTLRDDWAYLSNTDAAHTFIFLLINTNLTQKIDFHNQLCGRATMLIIFHCDSCEELSGSYSRGTCSLWAVCSCPV